MHLQFQVCEQMFIFQILEFDQVRARVKVTWAKVMGGYGRWCWV